MLLNDFRACLCQMVVIFNPGSRLIFIGTLLC